MSQTITTQQCTVRCCYNVVQNNTIFHEEPKLLRHYILQNFCLQKTPHSSPQWVYCEDFRENRPRYNGLVSCLYTLFPMSDAHVHIHVRCVSCMLYFLEFISTYETWCIYFRFNWTSSHPEQTGFIYQQANIWIIKTPKLKNTNLKAVDDENIQFTQLMIAALCQCKIKSLRPSDTYMCQWSNHHWFR